MNSNISCDIIDAFIEGFNNIRVDAVVGIESRGFLYGFLLANKIGVPFIPIRKSGKLPGDTISMSYDLEYGKSQIEIHQNDIDENWNVLIHDDLLYWRDSHFKAASELLLNLNVKLTGFSFVVNLQFLKGKNKLEKYSKNIITLIDYK